MRLTQEQKQAISIELKKYLAQHKISSNEFSARTEINPAYISAIVNGKTYTGSTEIQDKWYKVIATYINLSLKKEFWQTQGTPQMMRMLETLQESREHSLTHVIIGETGCGKSFTSGLFKNKYPVDTYIVTIGSNDKISDIIDKIMTELRLPNANSTSKKITSIAQFLRKKQLDNEFPVLIFDECEYMKQPALCAMKELYDGLVGYAGLVMIGTDQLLDNLDKMRKKNRAGIPQFYRRIKFGIRELSPINRSYEEFLTGIEDKELVKFLKANCDNYGELHDVLVPAMREADRLEAPLTLDLVRKILGNPRL